MSEKRSVEATLPSSPDWWQRHLWQVNPDQPYMNSFTRWRVSALYPVRRFKPRRQTAPKTDQMSKKVKAHG